MERTRSLQEKMTFQMKEWQKAESDAIRTTKEIGRKTNNPLIKTVMEIINADSARHKKTQQLIIDSLAKKALTISVDDMANVWNLIEKHIDLEKRMVYSVEKALRALKPGRAVAVQQYLLEYLLEDEKKHETMLEKLSGIKKGMYP